MSNILQPVNPPIIIPQPDLIVNNIQIVVSSIDLGKSASLTVYLHNNLQLIDTKYYTMEGEDYLNWGNNDDYVYNWVIAKLSA